MQFFEKKKMMMPFTRGRAITKGLLTEDLTALKHRIRAQH